MTYTVFFVEDAEKDLLGIYEYIKKEGYPMTARQFHTQMKKVCESLSKLPKRGHIPTELERVGVFDYREIHLKVYRIVYQIIESRVYIHCILDGKRDIQSILQQRLLS